MKASTVTILLTGLLLLSNTSLATKQFEHGVTSTEIAYICHKKDDYATVKKAVLATDIKTLDRLILQGHCWYLPEGTKYILVSRDIKLDAALLVIKRAGDPIALEGWTIDLFR